jgi:AmiR/NasT family two-component response regulator
MTESLVSQPRLSPDQQSTSRALDTAIGILVGWRRCSTHAAFRELISASERRGIPIFALASALVALASVSGDTGAADNPARLAAEKEWGLSYLL